MQSARLLGRRLRHCSPTISPHCFSALSGCPVPPASPRPRRPWSAAPRAGGASRCCASSEKLPMTRKMRCSARRWSTWRRDGLASGWRRPSAGLRVITPRASGSPPPRPRLVGAGTQQWPAELSAGSSIDGNRAIMRAAHCCPARLHTLHEGVLTTAPPRRFGAGVGVRACYGAR